MFSKVILILPSPCVTVKSWRSAGAGRKPFWKDLLCCEGGVEESYVPNVKAEYIILLSLLNVSICFGQLDGSWGLISPAKYRDHNSIVALSRDRWIVCGGNEMNDPITSIFTTDNAGSSWNIVEDAVNAQLTDLKFLNQLFGIAVGWSGTIRVCTDGGFTWKTAELPSNARSRNYNSVSWVGDVGIAVGGNPSLDSIQTIIKTSDFGENWEIILDRLGPQCNDMISLGNRVLVVGDDGVIISSDDNGNNWSESEFIDDRKRTLKSIDFYDLEIGLIVGGNPRNDSIQTIYKTLDGGLSWDLVFDRLGPMLNDVQFIGSTALSVGNDGVMLVSDDFGSNWIELNLPDSINDTRDLRRINFLNENFGFAAGRQGKILKFNNKDFIPPEIIIENLTAIDNSTININYKVNPKGSPTTVVINYGSINSFENMIQLRDTLIGDNLIFLQTEIENLIPGTKYYYSITVSSQAGIIDSEINSFITGDNPVPNWSFELWDSITIEKPTDWLSFGITSFENSFDNSQAIKLQGVNNEPGALVLGAVGEMGPTGGIYYPFNPDTIALYLKYLKGEDDSGLIILQLKDASGELLADEIYSIEEQIDSFTLFKFPIEYLSVGEVDTLLLALTSTNFFTKSNPNSCLVIDSLHFIGDDVGSIINGNFENSEVEIKYFPDSWNLSDRNEIVARRSTEAYHGTYAIELFGTNVKISQNMNESMAKPFFSFPNQLQNFNGYLKFLPESNDSLYINVSVFRDGVLIGNGYTNIGRRIEEYEKFDAPIYYFDDIQPDSASISIGIYNSHSENSNSYLLLDHLYFEEIITNSIQFGIDDLRIFPSPVSQILTVERRTTNEPLNLEIFDSTGKLYLKENLLFEKIHLSVSQFPKGIYFLNFSDSNGNQLTRTILKN